MGNLSSRNAGVEEVAYTSNNAYRYPPKSGCYFGSYFIMGGERFETTQPESYLFGENSDLNFLGSRPVPFPYPAPQANEPTKTLKSLVNIRKDTLKFLKVFEESETPDPPYKYNVEFTFDSDVRVAITVYYFATEELSNGQAIYHPRDPKMNSETYHYKRGANQTFSQAVHIICPHDYPEEDWKYSVDKEVIPIVIQCVVEDEAEHIGHSHMTFATVDKSKGAWQLKPLKQKVVVDGLCYILQEIFGLENKNADRNKIQDDDNEEKGTECVVCINDIRDTLILPCRHLCLCNNCAITLRFQANDCPICRAPFRALLQIRALRKKNANFPSIPNPTDSEESSISQEGVPAGYEAIALIEALNGPTQQRPVVLPSEGLSPTTPSVVSGEMSPILDKKSKRSITPVLPLSPEDEISSPEMNGPENIIENVKRSSSRKKCRKSASNQTFEGDEKGLSLQIEMENPQVDADVLRSSSEELKDRNSGSEDLDADSVRIDVESDVLSESECTEDNQNNDGLLPVQLVDDKSAESSSLQINIPDVPVSDSSGSSFSSSSSNNLLISDAIIDRNTEKA